MSLARDVWLIQSFGAIWLHFILKLILFYFPVCWSVFVLCGLVGTAVKQNADKYLVRFLLTIKRLFSVTHTIDENRFSQYS